MIAPEEPVVFAAPLLDRFPSIEGDEEDGEEQLHDGEAVAGRKCEHSKCCS